MCVEDKRKEVSILKSNENNFMCCPGTRMAREHVTYDKPMNIFKN